MDFLLPEQYRLAIFCAIALPCAFIDATSLEAPRIPLLALIIFLTVTSRFPEAVIGGFSGLLSFYSARKFTRNKLGLADVWMAGCIGALGGMQLLVPATLCAILLVLPYSRQKPIPFLPALFTGTLYALFLRVFLGN